MQFQQLQQRSPWLCTNLIWEQLWTHEKNLKKKKKLQKFQLYICKSHVVKDQIFTSTANTEITVD